MKVPKNTPEYVLEVDDLGLYIQNENCILTHHKHKALKFHIGFDDEKIKIDYYQTLLRKITNNINIVVKSKLYYKISG